MRGRVRDTVGVKALSLACSGDGTRYIVFVLERIGDEQLFYALQQASYLFGGIVNAYMRRWRREILNAGVEIPDGTSLYHSGGYPKIGLAPLSLKLATRSTKKLEHQLVHAELKRGNIKFRTLGLSHLDIRLANELVSVYLGLAERFRGVYVECIDFSKDISANGRGTAAITTNFAKEYPQLHSVALDMDEFDVREVVMAVYNWEYDRNTKARVEREFNKAPWSVTKRDAFSHGYIELSEHLGHPQCLGVYHAYGEVCNLSLARRGKPLSLMPMHVSWASAVLIHEFGHAVENAVLQLGPEYHDYVIGVLEECILRNPNGNGRWRISDRKLKAAGLSRTDTHLKNWPKAFDPDNVGNGAWRKAFRETVGWEAGREVGLYASTWLDECFAESFMQAIASSVSATRVQLAPFLESLYDIGLSVKRRRNV